MDTIASASDGHTFTHTPKPMQSSGEMASVYCRPAAALPFAGTMTVAAGAAAASSSVRANGRMVACGPVSYTHLDVYKRQNDSSERNPAAA